ncbi:phenylalanine 4-monooxygenase [Penaeicola halotolerans]|uniref:phenylalanine 4-monooxygenase n=1 Tax=Penaeicola halotolerans TaxID=2793196 RepID=UPI001CF878C5|nr:phenylalanine 4-monooxygenase [Penaeicola halotolerans]
MAKSLDWVYSDPRFKKMKQDYAAYDQEAFNVWKILYDRQIVNLPKAATKEYMKGLEIVKFTGDKIPNFEETNEILLKQTGWAIEVVPGLIDDDLFFSLMSNKRFPASTWLRKMSQLDYLEEPDMFHDVFAHVPLLTNQPFVDFLQELSKIAFKHSDDKYAIELLSRIYWFTIEFGLIREDGELRIYGAGILSSAGETKFSLSDEPAHHPYNVAKIMNTPYWKDKFQDKYFVIDNYEQLYKSLPEIERVLDEMLSEASAS